MAMLRGATTLSRRSDVRERLVRQGRDSDARSGLRFRWHVGYVYGEALCGWIPAWHSGGVGLPRQVFTDYSKCLSTLSKRLQALCRWFQDNRCRVQQFIHQRFLLCRCSCGRLDWVCREVCTRRHGDYVVWMRLVSGYSIAK